MTRRPRGYVGKNHETIGSDILAVFKVVLSPEKALGAPLTARLKAVKPDAWYPIALMEETLEALAGSQGHGGLVQMGRNLFRLSHEERVKTTAKSAADILFNFDAMYRHANRGEAIGGWELKTFSPGRALIDKTTPHHCALEEGIMAQALSAIGINSLVTQKECFRKGADSCLFLATSSVTDERWMGGRPPKA